MTSLHASIKPALPCYLQHAGRLNDDARRALASKTIIEEPRSLLPEALLHGASSLLESYIPTAATSQHRGDLSIGWVCLMLEKF
jgi:hypothetical protein